MKKVTVEKGFLLTTNGGDKIPFKPGVYELEDEIADHWYVKAHSTIEPEHTDLPVESEPEISETVSRKKPKRRIIGDDNSTGDGEEEETE